MTPLIAPPTQVIKAEVPDQLRELTPARYISYLIHAGHTTAARQFCAKTKMKSISFAYMIACIAEGHVTVECFATIKRIPFSTIRRCIREGYISYTDSTERTVNHKPVRRHHLTAKGTRAWNKIRPHTRKLIANLKNKIHPQ